MSARRAWTRRAGLRRLAESIEEMLGKAEAIRYSRDSHHARLQTGDVVLPWRARDGVGGDHPGSSRPPSAAATSDIDCQPDSAPATVRAASAATAGHGVVALAAIALARRQRSGATKAAAVARGSLPARRSGRTVTPPPIEFMCDVRPGDGCRRSDRLELALPPAHHLGAASAPPPDRARPCARSSHLISLPGPRRPSLTTRPWPFHLVASGPATAAW